ncbi:MAG TPA: hypothetical protein VGB43_05610, partial [Flavobacterium sp.]
FNRIDKAWSFNSQPTNPTSQTLVSNWPQWRVLLDELGGKPQSTIGAFRKKAKILSQKAKDLGGSIPVAYNKPEIKSRIAVLQTKINSLNLFINLNDIPDQKIIGLIKEINIELASLQQQMAEIVRKTHIPKEEGESDMIRMLDTSRAIPNVPKKPNRFEQGRRFPKVR